MCCRCAPGEEGTLLPLLLLLLLLLLPPAVLLMAILKRPAGSKECRNFKRKIDSSRAYRHLLPATYCSSKSNRCSSCIATPLSVLLLLLLLLLLV